MPQTEGPKLPSSHFLPNGTELGGFVLCDLPEAASQRPSTLTQSPVRPSKGERLDLPRHVLGSGAFGITYFGVRESGGEQVAIKELFIAGLCRRGDDGRSIDIDPVIRERWENLLAEFQDEASALGGFSHPNIVRYFDDFRENGTHYLVMAWQPGETLQQRIEGCDAGKALAPHKLVPLMRNILAGLLEIHSSSAREERVQLHRDVKPSNIYLPDDGAPYLLDLGGLQEVAAEQKLGTTALFTPHYAPLEQYSRHSRNYGPWTDLYGLGATCHHALSAILPDDCVVRNGAMADPNRDPMQSAESRYSPAYPLRALQVIDQMFLPDHARRPQSVEQAISMLRHCGQALAEATPAPQAGTSFHDTLTDGSAGPEMVVIPAGDFRMGDHSGEHYDELPVHRVEIKQPFAMGRYPVTVAEYQAYLDATGADSERDDQIESVGMQEDHPAVNISWEDAQRYIDWLCEQTGKRYRLPSEAEWEYAARAGTQTAYWWGDKPDLRMANCPTGPVHILLKMSRFLFTEKKTSVATKKRFWQRAQVWTATSPVTQFPPNPFGLHDTAGNVWEWCEDVWHKGYEDAPTDGSAWLQGGDRSLRVLRGGSWRHLPENARSSYRLRRTPGLRFDGLGFRLLQDL